MGNRRQKWTEEEKEALKAGVARHGAGKWRIILVDSELAPKFIYRSNVDLKDKWRNMCVSQGQSGGDNSTNPKANDHCPRSTQNMKIVHRYIPMIFDALSSLKDPNGSDIRAIAEFIEKKYELPQTFRRRLLGRVGTKLRRLVVQKKIEKVQHCYKMIDVVLATKKPSPKQKDVRPKPLQTISDVRPKPLQTISDVRPNPLQTISDVRPKPMQTISREMKAVEDAAKSAARWISEAEYEAFVMSEAMKESESVSQMAEE